MRRTPSRRGPAHRGRSPDRRPFRREALSASKNARSLRGSLRPGDASVPLAVSTAYGRATAIASATFSAVKPPLRISGTFERRAASSVQSNVSPVPPRSCWRSGEPARPSSRWKSTWKRSRSRTSPGPETCAALITRAPLRRVASAQNDGPSSPCSCSMLSPSSSLVRTTSSSGALTNTPHSSTLRRSTAAIRCASANEQAAGCPRRRSSPAPRHPARAPFRRRRDW